MGLTTFPLGPATVSGQNITVDQWLKKPEIITRRVGELAQQNFIAGDIFDVSTISTGSVVVETPDTNSNDLFTKTDVQKLEPGSAYPRADIARGELVAYSAEKWGHEFEVTDEARDDNEATVMQKAPRVLANTLTRKLNLRAVATIEAAATAYTRTQAAAATWTAVNALTADSKTNASSPLHVFALAQQKLAGEERGWEEAFDTVILNPQETFALTVALGKDWKAGLADAFGIKNVRTSARVTAGTAYYLASGQVGAMRFNTPLTVSTYREENVDSTILKAKARFIPYVSEPYAFLKLTGLA